MSSSASRMPAPPDSSGNPAAVHAAVPPRSTRTGARTWRPRSGAAKCASVESGDTATIIGASGRRAARRAARARTPHSAPGICPARYSRLVAKSTSAMSRPGNMPARRAASISKARRAGVRPGTRRGSGPVSSGPAPGPAANTAASRQPMRSSHDAVTVARAPSSSMSTMRAPRTGAHVSVACASWPPGAWRLPGRWPASYSSRVRTSNR